MNNFFKGASFTLIFSATAVTATPVDLSSWTANGGGTWSLQSGNDAVVQSVNGQPTVFHNGVNSQGQQLSGEITVQTTSDDDFIGFVLGYNNNDLSDASADYLLIDWKQNNQTFSGLGTASRGLAISRVTDSLTGPAAWEHNPDLGVEELQRGTNLGDTGWADNTTYSFDLIFTAALVEVFVDGVKELSINGSFNNGSFGFYNYSQGNVLYAGITETVAQVPEPAALILLGLGLVGMGLSRKK